MTATLTPPRQPRPPAGPADRRPSRWRSRRIRRAWIVGGGILTAVALVITLVQIVASVSRESFVIEEAISSTDLAGVRIIEVENGQGSVTIVGTDDDDLRLTTDVSRGLRPPTYGWSIEGDRLVVQASCPQFLGQFCEVDHDIQVPRAMDVVLDVEDGHTSVSDIDGSLEANLDRGDLDLVRIEGPITARVDFGALRASQLAAPTVGARVSHGRLELSFAATPTRVSLDSQFADVDISVPDEPGTYAVSVETQFGTSTNGLRTDPRSASSIDVTNKFGRVTLGYSP